MKRVLCFWTSFLPAVLLILLTRFTKSKCQNLDTPRYWGSFNPPYVVMTIIPKNGGYIVPLVSWEPDSLEPHINKDTFNAHYWGHHASYKNKMNTFLKQWGEEEPDNEFAKESILTIMRNINKVPEKFRTGLKNMGGGFVNHCFYWSSMNPPANITQKEPEGRLKADIDREFGSVEAFKEKFNALAVNLLGSGYVWLSRAPASQGSRLVLHTTVNQDSPLTEGLFPLLVIDVWEHAYYLKHQYKRADHIPEWWKITDWANVEKLDEWWQDTYPDEMTRKDEL